MQNTGFFPTDAYGTLEFQGTGEGDKAKVRMQFLCVLIHCSWNNLEIILFDEVNIYCLVVLREKFK